ncbi:hypothetical protein Tco_1082960 [Tanacetum coccineum]|uniref:Xylulose kinase-1 n=1 Tax=Tanacetum coccineum TaxID=301880 RepID=A0ABQ5I221_9ASTR
MPTLTFADTHNMIRYALTVNPTIYTSCIQQFWATTRAKTVNGVRQIQALIDKKKLIIMETSIRSDLHLEDAGVFINQQLGDMSHHKKIFVTPSHTKKIFANMKREGKDFSGRITPLFETMMVQPTQDEGVDSGIPVLDLEKVKDAQAKEIADLKKRVQRRVESSNDQESLGDHENASQQGRSIKDIDKDVDVSLVDDTQGRSDDADMLDINDLHGDEVNVDMPDEITLAQTLIQIKAAKPKVVTTAATTTRSKARGVVVQEPSEFRTPQEAQPSMIKDKGKAIMIEPEVPLKRKDHVALDEDLARNLQAQLEAEIIEKERLARKQEEEGNIALIESWDNTQAMIDADFELAQKLQIEEQGEITIEERSRLFLKVKKETEESSKDTRDELEVDKSKKAESSMEKAKGSKKKMLGRKRAGKEQQQESSKRQRMEDDKEIDVHEEVEVDDEAELKKHLVIVKDDEIAIDAIPLATKPPVIVEYKLLKEGIIVHYQLIRADGSSKRYSSIIRMLQDIDREDL